MTRTVPAWRLTSVETLAAFTRGADVGITLPLTIPASACPQPEDMEPWVMNPVIAAVQRTEVWARYARLRAESDRLAFELQGLDLEELDLKHNRQRIELEAPAGMAAELVGISDRLNVLARAQSEVKRQQATLPELLAQAEAAVAEAAGPLYTAEARRLQAEVTARRTAILEQLFQAASPALTELVQVQLQLQALQQRALTPEENWGKMVLRKAKAMPRTALVAASK